MIWVFLPAFNEEIALPILIGKFAQVFEDSKEEYKILIYDDGSSDRTHTIATELAGRYPIVVKRHEKNAGLGQTLIDGFKYLNENTADDDLIVTLDCDDTHEPKYLRSAIEEINKGNDLVVLSRFQRGGGQEGLNAIKTFLSMGAGIFLKIFFPVKGLREYSCNYRVYRSSILKKAHAVFGDKFIQLQDQGFVATPEILIRLRMLGAKIAEVPFVLRYDQKPTPSSNNSRKTIIGYMHLVRLYLGKKC